MKTKNYEALETTLNLILKYFKLIVAAAAILILLSGIVAVDNDEVAIILRFGKVVENDKGSVLEPGLHFAFPYFIDEVIRVPVGKIQEQTVDTFYASTIVFNENLREMKNRGKDVMGDNYIITGDQNVVRIKVRLKYRISDPLEYAIFVNDPQKMIDGALSGELNSLAASMRVDNILTSGQKKLAEALKENVQNALSAQACGITITNIEFTDLTPPREAMSAFEEVNAASVQKETLIQEANQFRASVVPEAQAEADALIQKASVNRAETVGKAKAEIAEFNGLYKQYEKTPNIIMDGIFRQRIAAILTKMGTSVVIPENGDPPRLLLP
jgi:membrane protease subunit HflK